MPIYTLPKSLNLIKPFDFQKFNELFAKRYAELSQSDLAGFKKRILSEVKLGISTSPIIVSKTGEIKDGYARLLCYCLLGIEPPVEID